MALDPNGIIDDLVEAGEVAEYRCHVCGSIKDLLTFKKDGTHEVWWVNSPTKDMEVLVNHGEEPSDADVEQFASR